MDETKTPIGTSGIIPLTPAKSPFSGLVIKIVVGIIVTVVVGTGVVLATRIWDPLWNPFRPEPEEVIEEMIAKMREVKTMHSEMKIGLSAKEDTKEIFKVSLTLTGESDNTDPENLKSAGDLEVVVNSEGMEFSFAGELKTIGQTQFIKLTTIPAFPLLQPYLLMLGIDLSKIKNQWIKYEQESYLKTILGESYKEELQKQKEMQEEMIKKLKEILKGKKLYFVKKEFPDEKIGKVNTYHYVVALNNEEIKKTIPELFKTIGEAFGESDLAGISGARGRAKEARIKADMSQLRTAAEIIYSDEGGYHKLSCDYSSGWYNVSEVCEDIAQQVGAKPVIHATPEKYCAYASLPVKEYYYCIDSRLGARITTDPEKSGFCDGKTFICPEEVNKEELKIAREKSAEEEFLKEMDEFFEKIGELSGELWIGKKDNLLYRFKGEKTIDLSKLGDKTERDEKKETITIKLDIEFSNFDKLITVEAPEKFIGIEEIISPMPFLQPGLPGETPRMYPSNEQPLLQQDSSYWLQASLLGILSGLLR